MKSLLQHTNTKGSADLKLVAVTLRALTRTSNYFESLVDSI